MARKTTVQAEPVSAAGLVTGPPTGHTEASNNKEGGPPTRSLPAAGPERTHQPGRARVASRQISKRGLQAESLSAPPRFASPDSLSMVTVIHP